MTLCELADKVGLILVIRRYPGNKDGSHYSCYFANVETKESMSDRALEATQGFGLTAGLAIEDYARRIRGRVPVFHNDDGKKVNIVVPENLKAR